MRGSLREIPFSDVVQLMVMGKKTGRLSVTNGEDFLEIYFKGGIIIFGKMINRKEKVGEILLSKGVINEETYKKAENLIEKGAPNFGSALIELGISEDEIKKVYEEEIKKFVSEAISWSDGYFNFEQDEFPKERPIISLDPSYLLIESAKTFDEWKKVQELIPSIDEICILKDKTYKPVDEKEKIIIEFVDGEKTVREVFEKAGKNLFELAETFKNLLLKGVIDTIPKKKRDEEVSKTKILEHINLGYAFLKTGLFEEAEREFRRLNEIIPDKADSFFYLGLLSIYKKEFQKAIEFLKEALKRDPTNPKIMNNLFFIYIETNNLKEAEKILEEIDKLKFEDERFLLNKAIYFDKINEKIKSEEIIKTLMKERSFLKTPYIMLAQKLYNEKKYLQVIEILSILKGYDPKNPEVNYGLGISYRALKKFKEAEDYLRNAIKLSPSNVKYKLALADLLYERGRHDESKTLYTQILSIDKQNKEALLRLGNIYLKEGKNKIALKYFEDLLKIDPENKVAKRNLEILRKAVNV
ncbi:MAG: tetratricopeptide repeat protein [Candidatus Hydrothermales bacterium]